MRLGRRDIPDLIRSVGGLLLTAGAAVVFIRKSGDHGWTDFELFLVLSAPALILYLQGVGALEGFPSGDRRPSGSVLTVASILLAILALFQFRPVVGVSSNDSLYAAGVFAVVGLLAVYAVRRASVSYAGLISCLSWLLVWLLVWDRVLGHPSADTIRWLLVAGAVLLLGVAGMLARAGVPAAGETMTAAGIAAVAAGAMGVVIGSVSGLFGKVSSVFDPHGSGGPALFHNSASGLQHFGWDLYLLVVSVAFLWLSSRAKVRGSGYAGGIGLLVFILSVGVQVTSVEVGKESGGDILGWPLTLVLLGIASLLAATFARDDPRS